MLNLTRAFFVVVLQCVPTFAQLSPAVDQDADRDDILQAIEDVSKAYVARDPGPFERIYLGNYVSIKGKPVYNSREQLLAMMRADRVVLKAGKKLDYDTISYESENPRFNFYGRTAILNIAKKNYWQYRGSKCMTRYQATEVWIKRDAEWKMAASHSTTFQCDPRPFYPIHAAVAAVPSRTKAPPNSNPEAEQKIRDVINIIAGSRSNERKFDEAVRLHTSVNFLQTNLQGEIEKDRSVLGSIPGFSGSRTASIRGNDDALIVFDDAALYTYRLRPAPALTPGGGPKQCTIFFAKENGRWIIAAAHISKYSTD